MGGLLVSVGEPGDAGLASSLTRMVARSPARGPACHYGEPGVAMAVQGSGGSIGRHGALVVALHGYLGNRLELRPADRDVCDATVLARLIGERGWSVLGNLRGELAVAVWDRAERTLLFFRDPLGCRPLFFMRRGGRTVLAAEARQALAAFSLPPELDEEAMTAFLGSRWGIGERTLFAGVSQARPGWLYEADARTLRRAGSFWAPPRPTRWRRGDLREQARELRRLLERAVVRALPASPSALALSGGIDSGALCGLVSARARAGDRRAAACRPISLLFAGRRCDERGLIEATLRATGASAILVEAGEVRPRDYLDRLLARTDWVPGLTLYHLDLLADAAIADGRRVLLTGIGGDEWLSGTWAHLPELLRRGRLGSLLAALLRQQPPPGASRVRFAARMARRTLRAALRQAPRAWPAWVEPSRRRRGEPGRVSRRAVLDSTLAWQQDGWATLALEQSAAHLGVEVRSPLMDLDLVEFAYRTPGAAFAGEAWSKPLLRRAVADLLAPEVRTRAEDTVFDCLAAESRDEADGLNSFLEWSLVRRRILLEEALAGLRQESGEGGLERLSQLEDLYWAERFTRTVEEWSEKQQQTM